MLAAALAFLLPFNLPLNLAADDGLTDLDRRVMAALKESKEAGPLVLHFDGRAVTAAQAEAAGKLHAGFHARIEKALAMKGPRPVHVFLYRDGAHMKELTGSGAGAFSTGDRSVHMPYDYDDCHELVHVFALLFPRDEDAVPADGFLVEGLATALQEEDNGIPISAFAAHDHRQRLLPPLADLRRSWPAGAPEGVHPYHVAGSFLEYVLKTQGVEKVKRLYAHSLDGIPGAGFAALERGWREWLGARAVPAETRSAILKYRRLGEHLVPPEALLSARTVPLFDGTGLEGWRTGATGWWAAKDGRIAGSCDGPWSRLSGASARKGVRGVVVRFRMNGGGAFQVRIHDDGKSANELIFTPDACFLARGDAEGTKQVLAKADRRIAPGTWNTLHVLNEEGQGTVWLNGVLCMRAGGLATEDGTVGLAVERGAVEVAEVAILPR